MFLCNSSVGRSPRIVFDSDVRPAAMADERLLMRHRDCESVGVLNADADLIEFNDICPFVQSRRQPDTFDNGIFCPCRSLCDLHVCVLEAHAQVYAIWKAVVDVPCNLQRVVLDLSALQT